MTARLSEKLPSAVIYNPADDDFWVGVTLDDLKRLYFFGLVLYRSFIIQLISIDW